MPSIKIKENKKATIKTINKSIVNTQKMKDNLIQVKEKTKGTNENEFKTEKEYAIDKVSTAMKNTPNNVNKFNKHGKNNFILTKNNIYRANQKAKSIKRKNNAKKIARNMVKNSKNNIKTGRKIIKTSDRAIKTTKQTVKVTNKVAQKTVQMVKATAKSIVQATKTAIKSTITGIKEIIVGTKALIAAIIAGGWVAIVIIVIICLIGMLCNSIFRYILFQRGQLI